MPPRPSFRHRRNDEIPALICAGGALKRCTLGCTGEVPRRGHNGRVPSLVCFSFHILFANTKRIWPTETKLRDVEDAVPYEGNTKEYGRRRQNNLAISHAIVSPFGEVLSPCWESTQRSTKGKPLRLGFPLETLPKWPEGGLRAPLLDIPQRGTPAISVLRNCIYTRRTKVTFVGEVIDRPRPRPVSRPCKPTTTAARIAAGESPRPTEAAAHHRLGFHHYFKQFFLHENFVAAIAAIFTRFKPMVREGIIKSNQSIYFNYNIISVAF